MRITHFGHSCLLVDAGQVRVLIDPGTFSHGFEQLTGLDAILITHAHPDHYDVARLIPLQEANDGALVIAEPETAAELGRLGFAATALHPNDELTVGGLRLAAVGGLHAVVHPDVPQIGNVGVVLSGEGEPTLFHPGDAYDSVPEDVEVLAVPLSAPWAALRETVEFTRAVRPRTIVPIHDGLLSGPGRGLYLRTLESLAPAGARVNDLVGSGATTLG